jgi:hypothetical protein
MIDDLPVPRAPVSKTLFAGRRSRKLARVLLYLGDLCIDALQIGKAHAMHVTHRLEPTLRARAAFAPAKGDARIPVGRRRRRRQQLIQPCKELVDVGFHVRYSALIFT